MSLSEPQKKNFFTPPEDSPRKQRSYFNVCTPVRRQRQAENEPSGVVDDKEAENKHVAVVALIDHQLERDYTFKDYALEREEVTGDLKRALLACLPRMQPTNCSATRLT